LVELVTHPQRRAHDIMTRRHHLRHQRVIAQDARIMEAFGLRLQQFGKMGKAWWYKPTHTGATAIATPADFQTPEQDARSVLSKKFRDLWQGPYTILQVGPSKHKGVRVAANNLMLDVQGKATRVHVRQCKPCKDPTEGPQPEHLPADFAKYLLSRHYKSTPTALTLEDVSPAGDWERHGVEAILNHRVVRYDSNQPQALQYLVRWEGSTMDDSWEPALNMDACPEAVNEYWLSLNRPTATVQDAGTKCVQVARQRATRSHVDATTAARCEPGQRYYLPANSVLITTKPSAEQLRDFDKMKTLQFMQVWVYDKHLPSEYKQWCQGKFAGKPKPRGKMQHVLFRDGSVYGVNLSISPYGTTAVAAEAQEAEWFLFGTAEQVNAATS
jgi:hypothetical protein